MYGDRFLEDNYFQTYVNQMRIINDLKNKRVLEVEAGIHFVARNLREVGYTYDTTSMEDRFGPTYLGNFKDLEIKEKYDTVACFQDLPRVPYKEALEWLNKMKDIAKHNVVISLPYACKGTEDIHIEWEGRKKKSKYMNRDFQPLNLPEREDGFWEIGRAGITIDMVLDDISELGFKIIDHFHSPHPYHYFIILEV